MRRELFPDKEPPVQTLERLRQDYLHLINHTLPNTFTHPVRHNHCFARIALDGLFGDCWYNHLDRTRAAYKQLSAQQLEAVINRMKTWLQTPSLLHIDNSASLSYRKKR